MPNTSAFMTWKRTSAASSSSSASWTSWPISRSAVSPDQYAFFLPHPSSFSSSDSSSLQSHHKQYRVRHGHWVIKVTLLHMSYGHCCYLSSSTARPPFLPVIRTFWRSRGSRPSTRFFRLLSPSFCVRLDELISKNGCLCQDDSSSDLTSSSSSSLSSPPSASLLSLS